MPALCAPGEFLPVRDIKPGMRGVGKTVFAGSKVEEFQVEILGVLENIGPKQSLILARLSGGPLEKTGVMQGMSGSPVYIRGKLAGAVAMAFPFSKEPIAGIRPIEEMLRVKEAPASATPRLSASLRETDLTRHLSRRQEIAAGDARLVDIATPVSFAGFSKNTLETFGPQLRSLGLEPQQGVSSGGRLDSRMGNPGALQPGSMISVQLMSGDLSIGADGTVTHIDGNDVYAFGHRFLSVGPTSLPFARAEVMALLPVLSSSFKISAPKELMGAISQDRNTAIAGQLGARAAMVPLGIGVSRGGRKLDSYNMQVVNDRFLSPLLLQMAVFSAIDATERSVGAATFAVRGQIEFQNGAAPIRLDNMFAADAGSAMQVSLSAAVPLAYVMQSGFEKLRIKDVRLSIESFDEKKQLQIDDVQVSRRQVRPGEKVQLAAVLRGENGLEVVRKAEYRVPESATPGPLFFTVADGMTTNLAEFRQLLMSPPKSAERMILTVNQLRPNTKAYVRVWRAEPAFQIEGEDLPDPPASVSMILSGGQTPNRNAKAAEIEIGAGDMVITGSRTVQVEVKE